MSEITDKAITMLKAVLALLVGKEAPPEPTPGEEEPPEQTPAEQSAEEAGATKREDGKDFFKSDYAYTPDDLPSHWKLRLAASPGGGPDSGIVGAACAALGPGFRGQKVQIPAGDLATVKAKVRAAWKKANPDRKPEEMPPAIREAATEMALLGDTVPLAEGAVSADGLARVKVIQPGWGSSGYYPPEILERDGGKVFPKNTFLFWDHPTEAEEAARPEGSLRNLAGKLVTDAQWQINDVAGPGLYADAQVFEQFRQPLADLAPHIGLSIRGMGKATTGEAEGRTGPIIQELTAGKSIDFVTLAGAGGKVVSLFESARQAAHNTQEVKHVTEQEAKQLKDANAALMAENARLREAVVLREAAEFVAAELAKVTMPDLTRQRLAKVLATALPIKEDKLDTETYKAAIAEAARAEVAYMVAITGGGQITGMGMSTPPDGKAALKESFKHMYTKQGKTSAEAEQLATIAAEGR